MKKTVSACLALCLCAGMSVTAQETLKVKFRSRALLDTSVSGYGKKVRKDITGWKIFGWVSKPLTVNTK